MMAINPEESLAPMHMATPPQGSTLQDLLAETSQYLTPKDMERIERAYELANRAHKGTRRRSGEAYIQHPLEVALLLADMRIDADGITAALLHDVVEDTTYSLEDLRAQFGESVTNIVDGVTRFDALIPGAAASPADDEKLTNQNNELALAQVEEQRRQQAKEMKRRQRSETVRKMLLAMAEDPRVVVLKLADRLHNMRTLAVMNPLQQQNKARETSEIYAPLARRLGMALVQAELEDLAFGRKDENLLLEDVSLDGLDKFIGALRQFALPFAQLFNPGDHLMVGEPGFATPFHVPVAGDAVICGALHIMRANLNLS